jgi:hypothetical protein
MQARDRGSGPYHQSFIDRKRVTVIKE